MKKEKPVFIYLFYLLIHDVILENDWKNIKKPLILEYQIFTMVNRI